MANQTVRKVDDKTIIQDPFYYPQTGKWRPNTKYSEPEIEILVNGESKGKFNGNYKRGMIKQAMKAKG